MREMIIESTGWVAICNNCGRKLCSYDIDNCVPLDEDEFIECLKDEGWVVDEDGEVYCCEECMKEKKENEND